MVTAAVPGVTTSSAIVANPSGAIGDGLTFYSYRSGTDTVTVRVCNPTAAAITPSGVTFNIRVFA